MMEVVKIMLGEAPPEMPPLQVSELGTETIWLVAKEQSKYWKYLDPKSCEPLEGQLHPEYNSLL
jgi:histone deacetylase 6